MMERVLGPVPEHMIREASLSAQKYFRRGTRLNWPEGAVTRESIRAVRKLHRLKQITLPYERPSQAVHLTFQSQGSCVGFCRY
uniref:Uncharacterized protein n=1 Tax=Aegilops tauschii subsp. strangulata TaxID=200361 RepID=A0A453LXY7_AEGTS